VIWGTEETGRRDLHAHELGRAVVDIALAARNTALSDAVVPEPHDA